MEKLLFGEAELEELRTARMDTGPALLDTLLAKEGVVRRPGWKASAVCLLPPHTT
jgi:hypothetical protein